MYLLGVDVGSSSEKVVVFDYAGNMLSIAKTDYPIYEEREGWAEQNAEDYYFAFLKNLEKIEKTILEKVTAICICGQTPTDIFVDKQGNVLRRAIMWRDSRAKKQFQRQVKKYTFAELEELSGCPIPKSENWTTLRMAWVKENESEIAERIYKVLQPKDYLIYKLSGKFVTDLWSARCFSNVHTGKPNEELLNFFGYNKDVVPETFKVADVCGKVENEEVQALGINNDVKIICGCSDGFAAMLSSGLFGEDNVAFNSTGTSEMAGVSKTDESISKGVYIFPKSLTEEKSVCFGPTQSGGASLIWFAKNVLRTSFEEMIELANQSPAGSNGLIFLPYINGERAPIWDSNAKGSFFGVKSTHTAFDFARSVLEGVAFSIRSIMEASGQTGISTLRLLGGGSKIPLWCQIRADILGVAVETVDCAEACAQGSAMIAGVGIGVYSSYQEAAEKTCKVGERYEPQIENREVYNRNYRVYKALYENTKELMKEV
jgi:xylulokinase